MLLSTSLAFAGQTVEVTSNKPIKSQKQGVFSNTTGSSLYTVDCSGWGFFADRPGNHKPYENESDYYTTICSNKSTKGVTVTFQQFAIEKFDTLFVWDELRTDTVTSKTLPSSKDMVGKYNKYSSPGTITSKKGCLTFRFKSDKTVVETGWYAKIGCAAKPVTDPCKDFNKLVDSELKCGVMIKDDNYRGKNTYELYGSCTMPGWPASGRELIYKFVNHKASDLTFTLKEDNGSQPKVLNMYILNDCKPDACLGAINRPAPNGKQMVESVTLKNAAAGTYYVVVDANKKYAHNWFKLSVECAGGDETTCVDPYYYDDFEAKHKAGHPNKMDYNEGDYISVINPFWSKSPGTRHARISKDRASNGMQSLEFNRKDEGTQDAFLYLGDKFKGNYRICWNMYIAPHSTAFFGLFGGDNSDPWGTVSKEFPHGNAYTGRWFDVELFVDLDKNTYTLYLDNRCKVYTGAYNLNLSRLMFYGLPKAHFYVDHICYGLVPKAPTPDWKVATTLEDTPLFNAEMELKYEQENAPVFVSDATNKAPQLVTNKLQAEDLTVMPNPTRGITTVALDLDQEQTINLEVFSPAGQLVKHIPLGKTQNIRLPIDLSDLSNGLYILKATGEQSVITKKIILQQ